MKMKGISVCNPVDIEKDYLMYTVEYAHKIGIDHLQVIGPIHNYVRGNIEGMTPYRKYAQFNDEKDDAYVAMNLEVVNEACKKAQEYGMKTYMWHHELAVPARFQEVYPEIKNTFGDVEITHPLIKDFLEEKIKDFFHFYPYFDGIILTLHETQIPLLKLKNQKLDKIERVQYVTQILFDSCKALGKELIVRPFASIEEDYVMMAAAYERISKDLVVMDKWTQFDWSLTMPSNRFFNKIKNNPLLVEADIFGEFFGKGRLPLMLKEHIKEKFRYCSEFSPAGYVARIDREGCIPFGDVNEVNLNIFAAALNGRNVEQTVDAFFAEKYGDAAADVKALMEPTEEILKKTIYTAGYYFSELSYFPALNHSKNHFYFEMMTKDCALASNEWFIPINWKRGEIADLIKEKETAAAEAADLYERMLTLEGKLEQEEYRKLWLKFYNLKLVTAAWLELLKTFVYYARYFETRDPADEAALENALEKLLAYDREGFEKLGEDFYCKYCTMFARIGEKTNIESFVEGIRAGFAFEKAQRPILENDDSILDFVLCGSAMEGHKIQKEVNFSDTLMRDGEPFRIPGNMRGMQWSRITAHGWFSYEVKVKPNAENRIKLLIEGTNGQIDAKVTIGDQEQTISKAAEGKQEIELTYAEKAGNDTVRIRIDKITGNVPCVFRIQVMK